MYGMDPSCQSIELSSQFHPGYYTIPFYRFSIFIPEMRMPKQNKTNFMFSSYIHNVSIFPISFHLISFGSVLFCFACFVFCSFCIPLILLFSAFIQTEFAFHVVFRYFILTISRGLVSGLKLRTNSIDRPQHHGQLQL